MCIRKCIHKSTRIENSTAVAAVVVIVVFFAFCILYSRHLFLSLFCPVAVFPHSLAQSILLRPCSRRAEFSFSCNLSGAPSGREWGVVQERRPNGGNETMTIIITWQRAARRNHSLYLVPTVLTTRLSCALFLTHYLRTHTFSIYVCMCEWLACIATCETCEKATFSRSFLRRVAASIWRMQLVHLL